jgi:uncharacterized protein (TIRG00374 family)
VYFSMRDVRLVETWAALTATTYWWLVPAVAAIVLTIFLKGIRWRLLFPPESRPPLKETTQALVVGYLLNNLMPARAGEIARVFVLRQKAGTSVAAATATIVIERIYDVIALLVLFFACQPWLPATTLFRSGAILALVLAVVLTALIVVLARWKDRPLRAALRPLGRLPSVRAEHIERWAGHLLGGCAGLRDVRIAAAAFVLTTVSWIILGVSAWLVMQAFELALPFMAAVFVTIATGLAMILPSTPGSLGVFEAATIFALEAYGISSSTALSYALVLHALSFVPLLAALPLVVDLRRRERSVRLSTATAMAGVGGDAAAGR